MVDEPEKHPVSEEPSSVGWFFVALVVGILAHNAAWFLMFRISPHAGLGAALGFLALAPFAIAVAGVVICLIALQLFSATRPRNKRPQGLSARNGAAIFLGLLVGAVAGIFVLMGRGS
jgi:uncharacterized membrane protein YfcA